MDNKVVAEVKTHTSMEEGFDPEYEYNKVRIIKYSSGAMSIDNARHEQWIYLYPDQVKILKDFLKETEQ